MSTAVPGWGSLGWVSSLPLGMRHNLSDVWALMRDRRSFAPEQMTSRRVHPDIVEEILRAGTWAGNHGMTQPWRFTVFMGEGLEILREGLPQWHALSAGGAVNPIKMEKLKHRLDACNCVIGLGRVHDPAGRISEEDEAWAVAGAVQNMHLTCTAYGLGAKWTTPGFMRLPEVKQALLLPAHGRVMGLFYVGYPKGDWPSSHRWPLEFVTRWRHTSDEEVGHHQLKPTL